MDCYDDDDDGGAAMQIQQQATAIKMQQYASTISGCEIMPKYYIGIGDNSDKDGDDRQRGGNNQQCLTTTAAAIDKEETTMQIQQ